MSFFTITPTRDLLVHDLSSLLQASEREGCRFIRRLVDDYESGANRFDQPGELLLMARDGDAAVGVCGLNVDPFANDPNVGRLRRLYVLPSHRRRGIGRSLLRAVLGAAAGTFSTVRVRTPNADVARYYVANGFVAITGCDEATQEISTSQLPRIVPWEKTSGTDKQVTTTADTLLDLWQRSVRATHRFLGEVDLQALTPQVRDYLRSDSSFWLLIDANQEPLGFMGLTQNTIDSLFLAPEYQRHGLGRQFVLFAQRRADELLLDVNEQNPAAIEFYQSCGFSVTGRSPTDTAGRPFPLVHMRWQVN